MISPCCSKHVEAWNKHIDKENVKLVINQNYIEMHGQQNIKIQFMVLALPVKKVLETYFEELLCAWSSEVWKFFLYVTPGEKC